VANVVLIASTDYLPVIKERSGFESALAFADTEALRALDVITRFRPEVVALDRLFAGTSRGAALINRIKADPALNLCEIRIVPNENPPARGAVAPAPAAGALDQGGTRRAPRYDNIQVEVLIDGNAATLVDLSLVGAQVLSPTILRPNQRVRLVLPDPTRPIRLAAWIAWASFEMPPDGPARYRAGVEFFDADPDAVAGFYAANKQPPPPEAAPSE
jgi:hypothetical protein